ncbi:YhcN/YlaJ family sporulation lipoprotein [Bacillus seohaeanensis]|jgi:YhcN/YlaJ family sporulation lipoprotein|uniref:YhcN/YlaJ family sporulation lipoprotein n=1 Tax=Bacillus seohaeanensis TaxID=284580 RepID=A0ABW5RTV0_9BACI
MKKVFSISTLGLVFALTLTGCGMANNGNEVGQEGNNNNRDNLGLQDVNYTDRDELRRNNDNFDNVGVNNGKPDADNLNNVGVNNDRQNTNNVNNANNAGRDKNNENYSTNEEAAKKVESIKGVEDAYVLTTENNAYVAVDIGNNDQDKKLERKISDQVKAMNKEIEHVYVSTNPGFFKSVREYGEKAENGKPVEGLGEEMANTIKRVFPDRK